MNWLALVPLIFKYGPLVVQFVQQNGPAIAAAIKDIEATLQHANVPTAVPPVNPTEGPNLSGPGFNWSANSGAAKAPG